MSLCCTNLTNAVCVCEQSVTLLVQMLSSKMQLGAALQQLQRDAEHLVICDGSPHTLLKDILRQNET